MRRGKLQDVKLAKLHVSIGKCAGHNVQNDALNVSNAGHHRSELRAPSVPSDVHIVQKGRIAPHATNAMTALAGSVTNLRRHSTRAGCGE